MNTTHTRHPRSLSDAFADERASSGDWNTMPKYGRAWAAWALEKLFVMFLVGVGAVVIYFVQQS